MKLPKPECKLGYTEDQIVDIFPDQEKRNKFYKWMSGQTCAICNREFYDYDRDEYYDSGCGPHGTIYYTQDVQRFIKNY
jgi:hypothetical protein